MSKLRGQYPGWKRQSQIASGCTLQRQRGNRAATRSNSNSDTHLRRTLGRMVGGEYSRPRQSNLVIEAAFRGLGRGFAGPVAEGQALALTLVAFNTLVD